MSFSGYSGVYPEKDKEIKVNMNIENYRPTINETRLKKDQLLDITKQNKQTHNEIYDAAVELFWIRVEQEAHNSIEDKEKWIEIQMKEFRKELNETKKAAAIKLEKVKNKDRDNLVTCVAYPQNFVKYYDQTIKQLELSLDEIVILSSEQFGKYVMNEWEWKTYFLAGVSGFSGYSGYSGFKGYETLMTGCAKF